MVKEKAVVGGDRCLVIYDEKVLPLFSSHSVYLLGERTANNVMMASFSAFEGLGKKILWLTQLAEYGLVFYHNVDKPRIGKEYDEVFKLRIKQYTCNKLACCLISNFKLLICSLFSLN